MKKLKLSQLCLALLLSIFTLTNGCKKKNNNENEPEPALSLLPYNYANVSLAAGRRFDADAFFTTSEVETIKGTYGNNRDYKQVNTVLDFTFMAPVKATDPLKKRPFVLLMHGGGFLSGSYTSLEALARSFAVRGYAAATIEYRLGFDLGTIPCVNGNQLEVLKAVYRATQDANAAMRYFVKNAELYGIDTDQLILFGSSAGNVISTSMIYNTQTFYDGKLANIQATLGSINAASNDITASFDIKAELTVTGYGLFEKELITATNARPAFYMQGNQDTTLPFNYGPAFSCPLGTYGSTYGSNIAYGLLEKLKFPYEHYVADGAEHDISAIYPSTFYVPKMAAFMKRLWKGDYRYMAYKGQIQTKNEKIQ